LLGQVAARIAVVAGGCAAVGIFGIGYGLGYQRGKFVEMAKHNDGKPEISKTILKK
jgi:hypothetical protein